MKYLLICVVVFVLSIFNAHSECTYCTVPDDWSCINDGGQELFDTNGDCYRGFTHVDIDQDNKTVNCYGEGYNKCTVPNSYWSSGLHNPLIEKALYEMYHNNSVSGSANINMYIDGIPRYGSVIWNKNTITNESTINTTIN